MDVPTLKFHSYGNEHAAFEKLLDQYLAYELPSYDAIEAGKRNRPRDRIWWGDSGAFVDLWGPKKERFNPYKGTKEITLKLEARYHAPGRPRIAVEANKEAVQIYAASSYGADVTIVTQDVVLPFLDGFVEALMVECPDIKSKLQEYLKELKPYRNRLQKQADARLTKLFEPYPPDPQQMQEEQRFLENLRQAHMKAKIEREYPAHLARVAGYVTTLRVNILRAQAHPSWPRSINHLNAGSELDWGTWSAAAFGAVDAVYERDFPLNRLSSLTTTAAPGGNGPENPLGAGSPEAGAAVTTPSGGVEAPLSAKEGRKWVVPDGKKIFPGEFAIIDGYYDGDETIVSIAESWAADPKDVDNKRKQLGVTVRRFNAVTTALRKVLGLERLPMHRKHDRKWSRAEVRGSSRGSSTAVGVVEAPP